MRKQYLIALLLLIVFLGRSSTARAQLVLPTSPAGVVQAPIDSNGWKNFKVTLSQNVTAFQFTGVPTPAQASVSVIFAQNGTGGFTVTYAPYSANGQTINVINGCVPTATALAVTICQFEFDTATSTWFGVTAGSSTATAGNTYKIFASPNCGGSASCSTVFADAHFVNDATTINTQNTITAPDGNFTGTDNYGRAIAKVGQICFGIGPNNQNGTLDVAQGTITAINSATSITCSNAANASRSGTEVLAWGDDDTANLTAAWALAVGYRAPLQLPSGSMLVSSKVFQDPDTTNSYGDTLLGTNNTYIIAVPNFTFTGLSATVGAFWKHSVSVVPYQLPNVDVMRDITFTCLGYNTWGNGNTFNLLPFQRIMLYNVTGWGCGNNDGASVIGMSLQGPSTVVANMIFSFGGLACQVSGSSLNTTVVFTGVGYCASAAGGLIIAGSSTVDSYGSFWSGASTTNAAVVVGAGSTFNSYADIINPEYLVGVDNSGTANFYGSQIYNAVVVATSAGLLYARAGSHNYFQGTTIQQPAGAGIALGGAGLTGIHIDGGANTIINGSICPASSCTLVGNASITGTPLTAAKLVLSANWGTSAAVSVPLGENSPISFTITNGSAAVGAAPTITYTFPTPYFAAPFWCTATQAGGTNPAGTFTAGTPTTTSVVFTYSLTPTVNDTEFVQVVCYGP
jgi:hypothetical protein